MTKQIALDYTLMLVRLNVKRSIHVHEPSMMNWQLRIHLQKLSMFLYTEFFLRIGIFSWDFLLICIKFASMSVYGVGKMFCSDCVFLNFIFHLHGVIF